MLPTHPAPAVQRLPQYQSPCPPLLLPSRLLVPYQPPFRALLVLPVVAPP
jgi:hypothetical protein